MRSAASENKLIPDDELRAAVGKCRDHAEFIRRLLEVYRQVDGQVGQLGLTCLGGGACCKFDLFDHRLYVSTGELALLVADCPPDGSRLHRRRCPYQDGPSCRQYPNRPLGCRTFFCGKRRQGELNALYERYHAQIRMLHQICCIPYAYGEATALMVQLFAGK
jgi:Fe-S-cluster containining protein